MKLAVVENLLVKGFVGLFLHTGIWPRDGAKKSHSDSEVSGTN